MNDLLDRSLHGVAIYNPRLLSKEELIGFFVARQQELGRLVEALRREAKAQPQHHLVVGARGMGKTTLLHRLRYAIEDDEELGSRCFGLVFPEEQYNVVSLADFWLNCVDALADGLESAGRLGLVEGIDEEIEKIQALPRKDDRGRHALELLCRLSDRLGQRLVLLVDNVDLVFDRLEDEQWALREVLSSEARIQLVGATSATLESHYRHDRAFYDFFRVHYLGGLDDEETFTVLRRLAEATGHDSVARLLDDEPGRVKTVRLMAGGNPRTIVMLFSLLAQGTEGDVRTDIERLLDQCTPLYKHRLEALPMQAQQVLDALAKHWDPATATQIAKATHLKVNVVSSQLDRLVKDGTVDKVSLPDTKRQGFQIAERFFNIWCLMRASRRVRRRLVWLVEFLRLMFGAEELAERARRHLATGQPSDALRHAELGLALADLVGDAHIRTALETQSIRMLCINPVLRQQLDELFDLEGQDKHLVGRTERLRLLAEAEAAILAANIDFPDWDLEHIWDMLGRSPQIPVRAKLQLALGLRKHPESMLIHILHYFFLYHQAAFLSHEFESVTRALKDGQIAIENLTSGELESARLVLSSPALVACALGMASNLGVTMDFERFDAEVTNSRSLQPWLRWAEHAHEQGISTEVISRAVLSVLQGHEWGDLALIQVGQLTRRNPGIFRGIEESYASLINPRAHESILLHASIFLAAADWPKAAQWLAFALAEPHTKFINDNWSPTLDFFKFAVQTGFTREARALLVSIGTNERWEPLDRALQILEQEDTGALDRFAPEMREAVRLVLARISPQTLEEPTPTSTKRRRPATKKS